MPRQADGAERLRSAADVLHAAGKAHALGMAAYELGRHLINRASAQLREEYARLRGEVPVA